MYEDLQVGLCSGDVRDNEPQGCDELQAKCKTWAMITTTTVVTKMMDTETPIRALKLQYLRTSFKRNAQVH